MNLNEQRIAIALACGKHSAVAAYRREHRTPDEYDIPDYVNDLNAMHEAEKILTPDQLRDMVDYISADLIYVNILHATAAQRAKAFLLTLNLWKG